ncbi:MAG: PINc/VapC family ATPase [Methanobacteriaceae archaeon]|nr:PINc/VapC family ATPase [Methanobacteriaceae archaeon]
MIRLVPDTSVIIDQQVSKLVEEEYSGAKVLIPEAVSSEIENNANHKHKSGYNGLKELKELQKLNKQGIIDLEYVGRRPNVDEISLAGSGEIDAIIRDIARKYQAILVTSDRLQKEVADAQGIETYFYCKEPIKVSDIELESYFDEDTMSVHLKENVVPLAKKGRPGNVKLVELDYVPTRYIDLERISNEIIEKTKSDYQSFIEIEKNGATVVQYQNYRVSIAKPPFANGLEITATRPVDKLTLENYNLKPELITKINSEAKGILVAGPPGAGKSTFAQALAEHYHYNLDAIVKTMESPRDLNLDDNITQYAPLEGSMVNTADILLLVRPDYTIYDEVRKTEDFEIFSDMRLAGVGMVGVVHATKAIDAIQRILGRLELGIIPSIVDTTIFIKDGQVHTVYDISLTVKIPTGMQEADLARPVIEIHDFDTKELLYEIYSYGEQTIVIEVNKTKSETPEKTSIDKIVEKSVKKEILKHAPNAMVEVTVISESRVRVSLDEESIPRIIGKSGKKIREIEDKIGINIDIDKLEINEIDQLIPINVSISGNYLSLNFKRDDIGLSYDILLKDKYLFTATVGKKAHIRLKKNIEIGEEILKSLKQGQDVFARLRPED